MLSSEKKFYEELSKQELSEKEVFEAKSNFVGFFDLLYRIDKRLAEVQLALHCGSPKAKSGVLENLKRSYNTRNIK